MIESDSSIDETEDTVVPENSFYVLSSASTSAQSERIVITDKKVTKRNRTLKPERKPKNKPSKKTDLKNLHLLESVNVLEKYANLNSRELGNLASRIQIYHEMGVVVPEYPEFNVPCKKKRKQKRKPLEMLEQCITERSDTFGQGRIGTNEFNFGNRKCSCCNVDKDNVHNVRKKNCCPRPLTVQNNNSVDDVSQKDEAVPLPILQLTDSESQTVQAFIDSVDLERVKSVNDSLYDRPPSTSNIKQESNFLNDEQDSRLRLFQTTLDQFFKRSNFAVTSTPIFRPVEPKLDLSPIRNMLDISGIQELDSEIENLEQCIVRMHSNNVPIEITPKSPKPVQIVLESTRQDETSIMDYVDSLLGSEEEAINQEVEERYQRLTENRRATCTVLSNAINLTDDVFHEEIVLDDNSVEIVDITPAPPIVICDSPTPLNSKDDSDVEMVVGPSTFMNLNNRKRPMRQAAIRSSKRQRHNLAHLTQAPVVVHDLHVEEKTSVSNAVKTQSSQVRECPICFEPLLHKEISSTICGHVFCTACIKLAIKTSRVCPTCRAKLTLKKIHPLFL